MRGRVERSRITTQYACRGRARRHRQGYADGGGVDARLAGVGVGSGSGDGAGVWGYSGRVGVCSRLCDSQYVPPTLRRGRTLGSVLAGIYADGRR